MDKTELASSYLSRMVVAIDGPAGSGKSTTARLLAERLGLAYLDTGAMYRAVTLAHVREGRPASELVHRISLLRSPRGGKEIRVLLDGEDIGGELRSREVEEKVSEVSADPKVREAMVKLQRGEARKGGIVLEGRDVGSVVVPWAHVKVFLNANLEVRVERRWKELSSRGIQRGLDEVEKEMVARDRKDSSRPVSPLKKVPGAYAVDTSAMSIEDQVNAVAEKVREAAGRLAELSLASGPSPRKRIRADFRAGQFLIRVTFRILWGMRILREETLDMDENYIFACNHLSYVDPPLVGSTLPREVHFMAKEELFKNPAFAWLIERYNAIPVRRGAFYRRAMERALSLLARGRSLLIFPEGTRTKGEGLGKPRKGVGYLALHSGVPVVPLYVHGSNRLASALLRRPRLAVVQGRPLRLTVPVEPRSLKPEDYAEYSAMVMEAISALKESYSP